MLISTAGSAQAARLLRKDLFTTPDRRWRFRNRKAPPMPDQATEAPVTDEELADAIRVRGRQVRNGIKVLQLILNHIPPETRRVPWNGKQDFYRDIPQPVRHQFLERLEGLAARHPGLDPSTPVTRSNPVPSRHSAPN